MDWRVAILLMASVIAEVIDGQARCYCPRVDAALRTNEEMRGELYRLRREATRDLPIYSEPSK